jgi:hypothetical protein
MTIQARLAEAVRARRRYARMLGGIARSSVGRDRTGLAE